MPPLGLKEKLFNCSYLDEISLSSLFLRSKASFGQKKISTNFVTLRKIFSYSVVEPKVTNLEYDFLKQHNMLPLEETSAQTLYDELSVIIDYTTSNNPFRQELADKIFEIRTKELKYILANVPKARFSEMKDGYKILDRYLEFIAG